MPERLTLVGILTVDALVFVYQVLILNLTWAHFRPLADISGLHLSLCLLKYNAWGGFASHLLYKAILHNCFTVKSVF